MKLKLEFIAERCSACGACVIACMDQNDIDTDAGDAPLRITGSIEDENKFAYISISCFHCDGAPCIVACPSGCLYKDEETGLTLFDTTNCIACHSCAMACPFGAPTFCSDGKMRKCDGCITRLRCGLEPSCVRNCPTEALRCYDENEALDAQRARSLTRIAKRILQEH